MHLNVSFSIADNFIALIAYSASKKLVETPGLLVYFVVLEGIFLELYIYVIILNLFQ